MGFSVAGLSLLVCELARAAFMLNNSNNYNSNNNRHGWKFLAFEIDLLLGFTNTRPENSKIINMDDGGYKFRRTYTSLMMSHASPGFEGISS